MKPTAPWNHLQEFDAQLDTILQIDQALAEQEEIHKRK
jgi:hypothetical protein